MHVTDDTKKDQTHMTTYIPKSEIDAQNRGLCAFSNAADAVVEAIFEIRKIPGHESFRGTPIEVGTLEDCQQKTALLNALDVCQLRAIDIGLDFGKWQAFDLPKLVDERAAEEEQPE